jgi:hypothetical protein
MKQNVSQLLGEFEVRIVFATYYQLGLVVGSLLAYDSRPLLIERRLPLL